MHKANEEEKNNQDIRNFKCQESETEKEFSIFQQQKGSQCVGNGKKR